VGSGVVGGAEYRTGDLTRCRDLGGGEKGGGKREGERKDRVGVKIRRRRRSLNITYPVFRMIKVILSSFTFLMGTVF